MASFSQAAFDIEAFDPDAFDFGTILASIEAASEGTRIDGNGVVQVNIVANNYTPVTGDVYILGTLHDIDGNMYVTEGALVGATDVTINSIKHTQYGVRYITLDDVGGHSNGENFITKGFVVDDDGRQYCETTGTGSYSHAILRDNDADPCDMIVNQVN